MKRKDGDGTFRKKPNGRVEYLVSFGYDMYGKRIRKSFSGKTEAECRRKAKEYQKKLDGEEIALNDMLLSDWLQKWVKTYKQHTVQSSTYNEYLYIISIICNHKISKMCIADIKPVHISDFFGEVTDYSRTIIKKLRFILNGAFEAAIDNELCYKNPVRRAAIPQKQQEEKTAYTDAEAQEIHDFAIKDSLFGIPMLILLHTGIRSGELRALRYCDIDIKDRCIHIFHSIKKDESLGLPKNGKARTVPITIEFAALLDDLLQGKAGECYIIGDSKKYTSAAGLRGRYNAFFRRLHNSGSEVPLKSPHCIRHTYSTAMQRAGVPLAIVSAILGHSSTDVTDKYTHLDNIEDLRNAIDSAKNPPQNPPL